MGGFQGVASTSTEKSLRVFNGRTRYNEWLFLPGQPRVIGRPWVRPHRSRAAACAARHVTGRRRRQLLAAW